MPPKPIEAKIIGKYKLGKTLGEGSFSKVKLATHMISGEKYAVKIIDKFSFKERYEKMKRKNYNPNSPLTEKSTVLSSLHSEVQLLLNLDHPNIIKLHQVLDSEEFTFIVMDYAKGGGMLELISKLNYLNEDEARRYFRQLVSAIDHSHTANIVHRDLKIENLMLDEYLNLVVVDFGLGKYCDILHDGTLCTTFCGTPEYATAELISGHPYDGFKNDIWNMGVILFYFTTGHLPFKGVTVAALFRNIKEMHYTIPKYISKRNQLLISALNDLITKILIADPQKRISMDAIRSHPWVTNNGILSPPDKIQPRFITGIKSIQYDTTYTILTINKHPKDLKGPSDVTDDMNTTPNVILGEKHTISASNLHHQFLQERQKSEFLQQKVLEDIALWHRIYQPAKTIRYTLDYLNLFSHPFREKMEPWRVFVEVHVALEKLTGIVAGKLTFTRIPEYYLFRCAFYPKLSNEMISFNVEIEKVVFRNRYHIKLKKLTGDDSIYKDFLVKFREVFLDANIITTNLLHINEPLSEIL